MELDWKHGKTEKLSPSQNFHEGKEILKTELLPDGRKRLIVRHPDTGETEDILLTEKEQQVARAEG